MPFGPVLGFVKGYARAAKAKLRLRDCYAGLVRELYRELRDYARKSWTKFGLFLLMLLFLLPLHLIVIPWSVWCLSRREAARRTMAGSPRDGVCRK